MSRDSPDQFLDARRNAAARILNASRVSQKRSLLSNIHKSYASSTQCRTLTQAEVLQRRGVLPKDGGTITRTAKFQLHATALQNKVQDDPQIHIFGENREVIEEPILPMEVKTKRTTYTTVQVEADLAAKEPHAPHDHIPRPKSSASP